MLKELGISGGTFILVCIALYFVIKWAIEAGMKKTNKLLDEIIANQTSDGEDSSSLFDERVGELCCIHLKPDSEYYFTMGENFKAKILSSKGGWLDITDIQPTGSGKFSGKVSMRVTNISFIENA